MYYHVDPIKILNLDALNAQISPKSSKTNKTPSHDSISFFNSPNNSLLVGITTDSIFIWNYKPFLLLSTLKHINLKAIGPLINLIWKPDSNRFFVLTKYGFVFGYKILYKNLDHFGENGESLKIFSENNFEMIRVVQSCATRLSDSIATYCGLFLESYLLVATECGVTVLTCELEPVLVLTKSQFSLDSFSIKKMTRIDNSSSILLSSCGKCFLVTFDHLQSGTITATVKGLIDSSIVDLDYCVTTSLLSCVFEGNCVKLFFIVDSDFRSLKSFKIQDNNNSKIKNIKWCSYGDSFMVLSDSLLILYSALGMPLTNIDISGIVQHQASYSIFDAFWALDSAEILLFFQSSAVDNSKNILHTICGVSIPLICAPKQNHLSFAPSPESRLMLFSSDKVIIHSTNFTQDSVNVQPEFSWDSLSISNTYLRDSLPIRCAASSSEYPIIAIAGKTNFAIYDLSLSQWRLYNSENNNANIVCKHGMVFYGKFLLFIANTNESSEHDQFLAFNTQRRLSIDHVSFRLNFLSRVLGLEIHDSIATIYLENNQIRIYRIFCTHDTFRLTPLFSASLKSIVLDPFKVQKLVCIYISQDSKSFVFLSQNMCSLSIILCEYLPNNEQQLGQRRQSAKLSFFMKPLASLVEWFVLSSNKHSEKSFNIWWYNGENLVNKSLDLEGYQGENKDILSQVSDCFSIRLKFYPLSIFDTGALVSGIEKTHTSLQTNVSGLSNLEVKALPFLHYKIRHLLGENSVDETIGAIQIYTKFPYFTTSLELLLLQVLEDSKVNTQLLRKVLTVIKSFDSYHAVLTNCARKSEIGAWTRLFGEIDGGLCKLFLECISLDKLETASNLLLVLYSLEEPKICEIMTLILLNQAKTAQNLMVCANVVKFIYSITQSSADTDQELFSTLKHNLQI